MLVNCGMLDIYNVISKAHAKNVTQRYHQNAIDKSKWNLNNVQVTQRRVGQRKQKQKAERTENKTKQKNNRYQ